MGNLKEQIYVMLVCTLIVFLLVHEWADVTYLHTKNCIHRFSPKKEASIVTGSNKIKSNLEIPKLFERRGLYLSSQFLFNRYLNSPLQGNESDSRNY